MKTMKKIFAAFIAVLLVAMMCAVSVSATGECSIVIHNTNTAVSMKGHTYEAYKVLDVEARVVDGETLRTYSVATAFEGLSGADYDSLLAMASAQDGDYNPELTEYAKTVKAYIDAQNIDPDGSVTATAADSATITVDDYGYYFIFDVYDDAFADDNVVSAVMVDTLEGATLDINLKADMPHVNKYITGVNADEDKNLSLVDASIGDHIWFNIDTAVPDTTGYSAYKFEITDTMSKGLTFDDNIIAYTSDGTTLTEISDENYAVASSTDAAGITTVTIMFTSDYIMQTAAGTAIVIKYSTTLNSNAEISNSTNIAYNTNDVYLTYSNDPASTSVGTTISTGTEGDTPEVEVKIYVLELNIYKYEVVDNDEVGLGNAQFEISDATGAVIKVSKIANTDADYIVDPDGTDTLTSAADGNIYLYGLEEGTYTVTETKAPVGYSLAAATTITVAVDENGTDIEGISGLAVLKIRDYKIGILPTTGGIGTVIFYTGGAAIMLAAVVLFIVMRKKKTAE